MWAISAIAVAAITWACSDPAARVRLVPQGACGQPAGANFLKITAYTGHGERSQTVQLGETAAIADFPGDTEQLSVEVIGAGGATGAAGKSAPLVFESLPDGATIPVFVAPLDGFCEVGAMIEPRAQPLIARAGSGVLVVGGIGPTGPVSTAEYYDPVTQTFRSVSVPPVLVDDVQGFTGAALATLPDGRVALVGGPHNAFVMFDSTSRTFATDPVLIDPRAFHAAIAIDEQDVVIAGGCSAVSDRQCSGLPRRQMLRYHLNKLGVPDPVTRLPDGQNLRIGAQLFDLGIQRDGHRGYLLAGGSGDPGLSDRFAVEDELVTTVSGGHVQAVALDGGAVLTAFADDATAADGAASVYPPEAPAARPVADAPDTRFVRLIALEDGRVVGFGGDPSLGDPPDRVLIYDPTRDVWRAVSASSSAPLGPLAAPALARLDDGSVLVIGGAVSSQAWLYRPSLIGPASGSVTAVLSSAAARGVLTVSDPATVTRTTGAQSSWILTASPDAPMARALVGGPRLLTGSIRAVVTVTAGGVALIAQQTGPGQAMFAELVPGEPARLVRLEAGARRVVCQATSAIAPFEPAPVVLRLVIDERSARLVFDDNDVLSCALAGGERGAWGVAALGAPGALDAGAQISVASVAVAR
jgi:hypothetical protein